MAGAVGWPEFLGQIDRLKYTLRKELRLYTRTLIILSASHDGCTTHALTIAFFPRSIYTLQKSSIFNWEPNTILNPKPNPKRNWKPISINNLDTIFWWNKSRRNNIVVGAIYVGSITRLHFHLKIFVRKPLGLDDSHGAHLWINALRMSIHLNILAYFPFIGKLTRRAWALCGIFLIKYHSKNAASWLIIACFSQQKSDNCKVFETLNTSERIRPFSGEGLAFLRGCAAGKGRYNSEGQYKHP